jgi:hypothetical protein
VIFYRRLLLQKLEDMEDGKPLPAHDPALSFEQSGYSCAMPASEPWQEVGRWQERQRRERPPAAAE